MAMTFNTDIYGLYATKVGNDANYQAPGNFGLPGAVAGGQAVTSTSVTGAGTYTTIPTFTASVGSPTATFQTLMKLISSTSLAAAGSGYAIGDVLTLVDGSQGTHSVVSTVTVATAQFVSATVPTAGTGYAPGDTLTLTGGTHSITATATVATTKLASAAVNAAGTGYVPAEIITTAGGTSTIPAQITVATTKVVSATIHAGGGGTGYGTTSTFTVTVAGGTHGAAATVSVTTNGGGVVTTINSVTAGGSYTVNPTLSGNLATGDNGTDHGTGLSLDIVMGVNTITISTAGSYTANGAALTQASTTGAGTGATFNTTSYGVLTVTPGTAGSYSVLPSNPVSTTGGAGTATLTALWGVLTVTVSAAGRYSRLPSNPISVTGGAGTAATFTGSWGVDILTTLNAGLYEVTAPTLTASSGAATATATLASATAPAVDLEKLLTAIEVIRSFTAEFTNYTEAKLFASVVRKMLMSQKYGSGSTFSAATMATNTQAAALNYLSKHAVNTTGV